MASPNKIKTNRIQIRVFRNDKGFVYRVVGREHSQSFVCAAVSALMINAYNSVKALTQAEVVEEHNEEGGFLDFTLPDVRDGAEERDAALLLESLLLGLRGVAEEYEGSVCIEEINK